MNELSPQSNRPRINPWKAMALVLLSLIFCAAGLILMGRDIPGHYADGVHYLFWSGALLFSCGAYSFAILLAVSKRRPKSKNGDNEQFELSITEGFLEAVSTLIAHKEL